MAIDPIVEQVRCVRRDYAERFDFDLRALAADLRKRQVLMRKQNARRCAAWRGFSAFPHGYSVGC